MHRSKDKQKVAIDKSKASELELADPRRWGALYWSYYEYIVATYPENPSPKHQRSIRSLFRTQMTLLPCDTCADNYRKIYKANPPQTQSKRAMEKWLKKVKAEVAKHSKK